MDAILDRAEPRRYDEPTVPLLFAVDHCFSIRGQGTILTGTVLQGQVAVGQTVELPAQRMVKKVKSMQMFRRPVTEARRGDRVGICIAQLDASVMERGLVAEPGSVPTLSCAVRPSCLRRAAAVVDAFRDLQVAAVEKIRFFKSAVPSKARFHITIGHVTAMADVVFFSRQTGANQARPDVLQQASAFSFEQEYDFEEELGGTSPVRCTTAFASYAACHAGAATADGGAENAAATTQWALLTFDTPVLAPRNARFIGSRLDLESNTSTCRLALHGCIAASIDTREPGTLKRLRVVKLKRREGTVERCVLHFRCDRAVHLAAGAQFCCARQVERCAHCYRPWPVQEGK